MTGYGSSPRPDDRDFRRRFRRADPVPAEPLLSPTEYRLADTLQRAVDDRLEEGLRAIEDQATTLMREVATEIWRSSSRDTRPEQERIIAMLSRDQAIRSLIASSDERFQALAVRTARLEDHLNDVSEAGRATREAMQNAAEKMREVAQSPALHSVETVQSQLEMVERHIAETFRHIDQREQTLQETILKQVRDHGELIAQETSRIVESMQGYVQGGAETVGRLAQRMEEHAALFLSADHDITSRVRGILEEQTGELTQQIDHVRETVGLHGREQDQLRARLEGLIESRVVGLGQLVRSDSEALRRLVDERGADLSETTLAAIDEKMTAFERITSERIAELERTMQDQVMLLSTATSASVERTMEKMTETLGSMDGLDELLAESQGASQERLAAQLGEAHERLAGQVGEAQDRLVAQVGEAQDRLAEQFANTQGLLAEHFAQAHEQLADKLEAHVDDRMTAIARLIRSDNQVLAEKVFAAEAVPATGGADPELMRQLLRSVKELQAGLASDVLGSVDRRFQAVSDQVHQESQSQAEAMIKIAEVLSDRIDRLTAKVEESGTGDLQIVIDRMSDAIQAMSSVGRRQAS
jgi:hypothetical protein